VRNKAHLVAQGFSQVKGINSGKTFAHVAHLEAIRILLAFTASNEFKLYQMDVKSALLNGVIQKEVFLRQPLGFENPKYPNRVHKLSNALYRLKQTPWAWYARLKTFFLEHGYIMMSVDKTLFTLNHDTGFLLVQIYVDDIIFGGSSHTLLSRFHKMMENEFQMSKMVELTFFLGIQVKQGTFVHQAKYTKDLMKKFNMTELKPISSSMSTIMSLGLDKDGKVVDQRKHKSMIGTLLYLTVTRADIQFVVCMCACFQVFLRSSHRMTVKWIFRYLKHTLEFEIWYSASSSLDLVGFCDADFASCGFDPFKNGSNPLKFEF
jgi:hypothetical protein